MSFKNLAVLTCSALVISSSAFASQYNFEGLTGTNQNCTVSFDINNDNSLVNLKISGAGLRETLIGLPESVQFTTTPKEFEDHGGTESYSTAYDQNLYADIVFNMGKNENGTTIAKAKTQLLKEKNKMILEGQSIADLESIYVFKSYGYLKIQIKFLCKNLRSVN